MFCVLIFNFLKIDPYDGHEKQKTKKKKEKKIMT